MAEKITANIGFEKKIWDAACVLRGNMDASEKIFRVRSLQISVYFII